MKNIVFIVICVVSMIGFSSCGSTSPCGLAANTPNTKQIKQDHLLNFQDTETSVAISIDNRWSSSNSQ
ncbi:conserved hypothetical protein [Tenacibaculum maritimum]|uniref:hypothetical protein n=1 Tax=Tenacibaculum maritimum TaxID=107401 RepID=UPI0012E638CE|nr:hypothetical protein [Tenacibaculum maritimum]CAA0198477.1 conserved hypothetical protein [Tenacibaculum maritimum]